MMRFFLLVITVAVLSSCAVRMIGSSTLEAAKTVWGSSTRVLEKARDRAITKTYDKPYWDTIRSAIAVMRQNKWVIFKKDEVKGYVVVMGVKGCVNTTEIAVFFDELSDTQTKLEIASLSTNAKRKVSKALFHGLDIAFGYAPPDL